MVARRRLVAGLGALVLVVCVAVLALGAGPCWLPGGSACAPADDAAQLVPADALAYVHANVDGDAEQAQRAAELRERMAIVSSQLAERALGLVPGVDPEGLDFESEIEPWLAGEIAVAVLADANGSDPVALFEAADAEGAERFAESLEEESSASASEIVSGFLVVGDASGVQAVADLAESGDETLADDADAEAVRDELPEERFAEAYASREGIAALVGEPRGALASLAPFVDPGASDAAAAALSFGEDGEVEVAVRSHLDPERAEASPGFFSVFERFDPELPQRLPATTLAYAGIARPGETVRALLTQASVQAPALAAGLEDLLESLERSGDIDVEEELGAAFPGEAAVAVQPAPDAEPGGVPYLEFIADDVDPERARRALATIAGSLGAPAGEEDIEGVTAQSVDISPTVRLTYAVLEELAVAATNPAGIAGQVTGEDGLSGDDDFEAATEGLAESVSLLAYFDLGGLLALGESLGLAEDPVYATFAAELRRLRGLGLAVAADDELLATDARLLTGD